MITLRSNNYANLLQFRSRKNSKKTESDNTVPEHKTRHSANNKYTTGIIATSAFIAGLGANKLLVPTESMANTKTEMYAPARNNTEEASSYEEYVPSRVVVITSSKEVFLSFLIFSSTV